MTLRRRLAATAEFVAAEAGSGFLLLAATVVALGWANSGWSDGYRDLWHTQFTLGTGRWAVREDLRHWVNDGLMALFFFLVGLEIKREVVAGELRDRRAAALPVLAAVGGMVVPAVVFLAIAGGGAAGRGWAIPMATDIAFAVGVCTLVGPRAPAGLRVFLLALAIVDDIGAIVVIAAFYSAGVSGGWLAGTLAMFVAVAVARRLGLAHPLAFVPIGAAAWYCTYRAGIHPTVAAVALGLLTPAVPVKGRPVLAELEKRIHPWSARLVVPLFALANAGVPVGAGALSDAAGSRLSWAVAVGLVAGKFCGVTGAATLALRCGFGRLASGVTGRHLAGAGALAGIGFTVSLFVTGLAFESEALQDQAKVGILAGSITSALLGGAVLRPRSS